MLPISLDKIGATDLERLITDGVSERRDLEFKRDLPGNAPDDLKEFLADVSSLANAQGGDLIFGIEDKDGVATALPGLKLSSQDAELLRLENIVRDGLEPRLSGLRLHYVGLEGGLCSIILRVPASLANPHRVRYRNSGRFYSRNSRGKYEMDVHELRTAFTQSEELPRRIRQLHFAAVESADGVDMPFSVDNVPTAIVSVVPITFFRQMRDLPVHMENGLLPYRVAGYDWLNTLEGILIYSSLHQGSVRSYALTHRTGRTDSVWSIGRRAEAGGPSTNVVWPGTFEQGLVSSVTSTVAKLGALGIEGPWVVFATITGAQGFSLVLGSHDYSQPAWRDRATLPEIILEHASDSALKPLINSFWLLFGTLRPDDRKVGEVH